MEFMMVLAKKCLIKGDEDGFQQTVTLTNNDSGKFEDRWVYLSARGQKCVFLNGVTSMYLPIAHAEGKFVTRDTKLLAGEAHRVPS